MKNITQLLLTATLVGATFTPAPVTAQVATSEQRACFVKDTNPRNKAGKSPEIPATLADGPELIANGYREKSCTLSTQKISDFRDQVCRLSALGSPAISAKFEAIYAISPARMCAALNSHTAAQ